MIKITCKLKKNYKSLQKLKNQSYNKCKKTIGNG